VVSVLSTGRLDGKVAIVTGAARGTGEIIAKRFASEGAKVVVADVLDDRAKEWVGELGDSGAFVHLDVTEDEDWQRGVAFATERFGPPTVLVNNAAVLFRAPITEMSNEEFDRLYRVNLRGPFQGIKAVTGSMKAAGGGSIINIGSSLGSFTGPAEYVAYAATKFGLRGVSRVAAVELGMFGIRINTLMAGGGSNEMRMPYHPGQSSEDRVRINQVRAGLPQLAARGNSQDTTAAMAVFLASDESYHCHGQDYSVDFGRLAGMPAITPEALAALGIEHA
jgi:3alpha(or 20beta)-hydroxysteroid dehydrogenase